MNTKLIYISKDDSIRQIQGRFSELFPYLRINIFKHVDRTERKTGENILYCPEVRMRDIDFSFQDGLIMISENMTVGDLEQVFYEKWTMLVQVTRKNKIPETDQTTIDHYLLKHANQDQPAISCAAGNFIYFRDVPYGC